MVVKARMTSHKNLDDGEDDGDRKEDDKENGRAVLNEDATHVPG